MLLTTTTVLLLLTTLISSTPINNAKRQNTPGVYMCADVNWGGYCAKYTVPSGNEYCFGLGELNGIASAVGPDEGLSCNFYDNGACLYTGLPGSDMLELSWPGQANLAAIGWNDRIEAFNCVEQSGSSSSSKDNGTYATNAAETETVAAR